jgi:hypothetical protein
VNSPTFSGRLPLSAAILSKIFLKIRGIFTNLRISLFLMSELPSLFIANSKISLYLKKNLPLDHRKKFTCMGTARDNSALLKKKTLNVKFLRKTIYSSVLNS